MIGIKVQKTTCDVIRPSILLINFSIVSTFLDNKTSSTITCAAGSKFKANNELERIADLNECHSQITGSVVNYNKNCANNGIKMAIGFQLNDGRGFVKLIDVCYDKQLAALIYTRHIVHGKSIKNAMKSNTRPSGFKTTELPSNVAAPKSYTKASQLKRFDEIFENSTIAEDLLAQTFLARGHSAPDGDFIFVSGQIATYHYINTMPQWQSINNANWKHIENEVRSLAGYMKKECIVYTGGFDVLEINSKRISLEPDGLAAPKWTWKIVKVVADNSGIAFVTFNNPFATQAPAPICRDICDEFGWDWKDRKSIQKGYTICCVITDLVKIHPVIPEEAKASNLINKTWK